MINLLFHKEFIEAQRIIIGNWLLSGKWKSNSRRKNSLIEAFFSSWLTSFTAQNQLLIKFVVHSTIFRRACCNRLPSWKKRSVGNHWECVYVYVCVFVCEWVKKRKRERERMRPITKYALGKVTTLPPQQIDNKVKRERKLC